MIQLEISWQYSLESPCKVSFGNIFFHRCYAKMHNIPLLIGYLASMGTPHVIHIAYLVCMGAPCVVTFAYHPSLRGAPCIVTFAYHPSLRGGTICCNLGLPSLPAWGHYVL